MDAKIILGIMGCILCLILAIITLVISIKEKDGEGFIYFIVCLFLAIIIGLLTHDNIVKAPLEWSCCDNTIYSEYCPDCGKERSDVWICCDVEVEGNFCSNCGEKRPEKIKETTIWTCYACSNENATGNYCSICGRKKNY